MAKGGSMAKFFWALSE
jgi:hypothetical protein